MVKYDDGLPARVSQQLLRRIIGKEFPPGTVLPSEREIGETYAVSRPVAREAIKLLAARGIVSVHPRQGATVGHDLTGAAGEALLLAFHQANTVQEDILNMRLLLEPHVASLAAHHATVVQLRRLTTIRQLIGGVVDAVEAGDRVLADKLWPQTDAPLHVLLAEMSQNPVFKIFVEIIDTILWPRKQDTTPIMTDENLQRASLQHAAILDAVSAHDPVAAQRAMIDHLEYTRDHVLSFRNQLQQPVQVVLEQESGVRSQKPE